MTWTREARNGSNVQSKTLRNGVKQQEKHWTVRRRIQKAFEWNCFRVWRFKEDCRLIENDVWRKASPIGRRAWDWNRWTKWILLKENRSTYWNDGHFA